MSGKHAVLLSLGLGAALLTAALCVTSPGLVMADEPSTQAVTGNPDDELIVLRNENVAVCDPYSMDGTNYVSWQVNTGSIKWRDVAAGDFNGDGDDEIVLINRPSSTSDTRRIKVYDPVSGPQPQLNWEWLQPLAGGRHWWHVATGDVNGDSKDEIVAVSNNPGAVSHFSVFAPTRVSPLLCTGVVTTGVMNGLTLADFDNNGRDEIMFAGHADDGEYDSGNGRIWFYGVEDGSSACKLLWGSTSVGTHPGVVNDLASGDVDGDGQVEAVMAAHPGVEPDPDGAYKSLAIWTHWGRYPQGNAGWWKYSYPGWGYGIGESSNGEFLWGYVDAGDLDGTGDDEIVAIRDPIADVDSLIVHDVHYSSESTKLSESFFDDADSNSFQGVKIGNFNGTGTELIALMKRDKIYFYRVSAQSGNVRISLVKTWTNNLAGFDDEEMKVMAVGDVDGARLRASRSSWSAIQDDEHSLPDGATTLQVYYANSIPTVFTATVNPAVSWLEVTPTTGSLPKSIALRVHSGALDIGTYNTTLRISGTANGMPARGELSIPIRLSIVDEVSRRFVPYIPKNR